MGYKDFWTENRSKTKSEKENSLRRFQSKVIPQEENAKFQSLVDLYLDAHDLVTKIGFEIAKISDKYVEKED
jgi:hypothetical protein